MLGLMSEEVPENPVSEPRTMTSPMLKAMANPLRRRIFATLAAMDFARAADLSERLNIPANSLSFHLRVMAKAGLIEEAPEQARDRRDRVWRAAPGGLTIGSPEHPAQEGGQLAMNAYLSQQEHDQLEQLKAVIDWGRRYAAGEETVQKGSLNISNLMLNDKEAEELDKRMLEALREVKRSSIQNAHDGSERRLWDVTVMMAREDLWDGR